MSSRDLARKSIVGSKPATECRMIVSQISGGRLAQQEFPEVSWKNVLLVISLSANWGASVVPLSTQHKSVSRGRGVVDVSDSCAIEGCPAARLYRWSACSPRGRNRQTHQRAPHGPAQGCPPFRLKAISVRSYVTVHARATHQELLLRLSSEPRRGQALYGGYPCCRPSLIDESWYSRQRRDTLPCHLQREGVVTVRSRPSEACYDLTDSESLAV